jgi:hypothetical protein
MTLCAVLTQIGLRVLVPPMAESGAPGVLAPPFDGVIRGPVKRTGKAPGGSDRCGHADELWK